MRSVNFGTMLVALSVALPLQAQYQVQQGHVLDANPRAGSAGLNTRVRNYDIGAGNRIVTGNVGAGQSFRGYSPIRDPNTLYLGSGYSYSGTTLTSGVPTTSAGLSASSIAASLALTRGVGGLPSDRLSNFQRDSYGLSNYNAVGTTRNRVTTMAVPTAVNPATNYYAPPSTVTNVGAILAGANRPGSSQVQSQFGAQAALSGATREPFLPENGLSGAIGSGNTMASLSVAPRMVRAQVNGQGNQPINRNLLASSLMGGVQSVPMDQLSAQASVEQGDTRVGMVDTRVDRLEPLDQRVGSSAGRFLDGWGERPAGDAATAGDAGVGSQPDLRVRSGDVFDQMVMQTRQMQTRDLQEQTLRRSLEQQESTPGSLQDRRAARPRYPDEEGLDEQRPGISSLLETPGTDLLEMSGQNPFDSRDSDTSFGETEGRSAVSLRTFVGSDEYMADRYMAKAEALLKTGQYYSAASMYDMARMLDMQNPLPLLGRSMAFLGAGDYMSSVRNLYQAINAFQGLGYFRIDLAAFIPDAKILEKRRADLASRLEKSEDSDLRFLLGYIQYCSGLAREGLDNMEQAARNNPEIRDNTQRFIEVLAKIGIEPQTPAELLQRARETQAQPRRQR